MCKNAVKLIRIYNFFTGVTMMKKAKTVNAIIKNDKGEVCHRIKDILRMALGRNETLAQTKSYIVSNYKNYIVEFEIK